MRAIIIQTETRTLIEAWTSGGLPQRGACWVGCGWQIYVDDDVYVLLALLDPNMDQAIRLACTRQYGNA